MSWLRWGHGATAILSTPASPNTIENSKKLFFIYSVLFYEYLLKYKTEKSRNIVIGSFGIIIPLIVL